MTAAELRQQDVGREDVGRGEGERLEVSTALGPVPVRRVGRGPAVLCVHGAFVDGHLWDATAARLAGRATVLLPDLPQGAHRTPVPDRSLLTPSGIARALVDVLDACEVGTAVVVGNDNGGAMSQVLAAEHPERTAGLVLAGCEVLEHFPPPAFAPFVLASRRWPGALSAFTRLLRLRPVLGRPGPLNIFSARGFGEDEVRRLTEGLLADQGVRDDLAALVLSLRPEVLLGASARLGYLRGRAEVVWPPRDLFFSRRDGERVAALLGTRVVWADGARTFVPLDRPDLVAQAVERVLERVAVAS